MEKLLYLIRERKLSLGEEFLNLVDRNDGLLEIIGAGLLRTFHADDLAVFFTQGTEGSNYFLCHNS